MKVLFLSHRVPYPPNEGGKIRAFHMIRHLGKTHDVVVASLAESDGERERSAQLKDYCREVLVEVVPPARRWVQAVAALPTPMPSSVAYFYSSRLRGRIRDLCRSETFDAVFVHCAFVAQYIHDTGPGFRWLDFVDMDSAKWAEYSVHRRFPLSLGYGLEAAKLRAYERKAAGWFHHCSVTTAGELDTYRQLGVPVPCSVLANGVDTKYFSQGPTVRREGTVLAFLGRMDYFPNVDGICFFARDVFPLIRAACPTAELRIIGMNPTADVRALAQRPGIVVTGSVPDVRPHLHDATVTVAPLRIARGTQNKVLESMSLGIPVVATTLAAQGVQAEPNTHLLVGDDPATLSEQVLRLLRNSALREQIARAAHDHVQRAHDWGATCAQLDRLLLSQASRLAA
jgi:hypothetical protein